MKKVIMLLSNAFRPDPRPYAEAVSLAKVGHKVKILCWDRGENLPRTEMIDGIEVERIYLRSTHGRGTLQAAFLWMLWARMFGRLIIKGFDVVYCHDFDMLPVGFMLKILRQKTLIFDSHEVYSRTLGENVWLPLRNFVSYLEKISIKKADFVIATCPKMAELYKSYKAENITVVGNWKTPEHFELPDDLLQNKKSELGITDELVISYIANLGPERIIKPLLEVVKKDKKLFLIIGGDGPQKNTVEKTAGTCSNIRYLGYVPHKEVPLYTALSDAVYYGYDKSALMAEYNSPNKLFEALAAGKAFIGGNFGQMGDIIKEENCGIALDEFTEDAVREAMAILKGRDRLQVFKENAKRAAREKYNWENARKGLLKIFSELNE